MNRLVLLLLFATVSGCSGTAHQITIGPPPAKQTSGPLVGGLCNGDKCTCRKANVAGDAGVGVPDNAAKKRYEIKIGPSPHQLWVSFAGTVLYKSAERPEECFYVDLATGDHDLEFRATNPDGVSAAFTISELGTKTKSWYETFKFNCGSPGVCSFSEMDGMKEEQKLVKRNLRDPCGSTKVKAISWDHGAAPDQEHPSDLVVRFTLDVYKFAPFRPTGDPACGRGGGRAPNDETPAGAPVDSAPI